MAALLPVLLGCCNPAASVCEHESRSGRVADAHDEDNATVAIRAFNAQLLKDERVSLAFVPITDGMALCTKRGM